LTPLLAVPGREGSRRSVKPEACSGLVQILSPRSVRANGLEPNEPGADWPEGGGGTVGIITAILVRGVTSNRLTALYNHFR
jgi:hypothetical protein